MNDLLSKLKAMNASESEIIKAFKGINESVRVGIYLLALEKNYDALAFRINKANKVINEERKEKFIEAYEEGKTDVYLSMLGKADKISLMSDLGISGSLEERAKLPKKIRDYYRIISNSVMEEQAEDKRDGIEQFITYQKVLGMERYCMVLYKDKSTLDPSFHFKIGEVNVVKDGSYFYFSTENRIFSQINEGDTFYSVSVPDDALISTVPSKLCPKGILKTNQIILSNPVVIDDKLATHLYKISKLPKLSYYKLLASSALMGYRDTCYEIIKDKVRLSNIHNVIKEYSSYLKPGDTYLPSVSNLYYEILGYLKEIEDYYLISRFVSKKPYYKELSDDKIINLTGESGSGKSYFVKYSLDKDKYLVVDTDRIFGKCDDLKDYEKGIKELFKDCDSNYLISSFDDFYLKLLEYLKDESKTIIIDSAQFRNIKDVSILKGQVVVMRTSISECFSRCIKRLKENNLDDSKNLDEYIEHKKKIFKWYHSLNDFILRVEGL